MTRYDSVLAKYNWAQEHIENFHTAVDLFRRENPHTLGRELDSTTGEFVYKVKTVPDIPERLRFMLGDALHNLRSTLDHAAHAVVEAGSSQPNSHTHFPVFDDAKAYISMLQSRVPGLRQQCYEVFNRIQPYKGGWGHWIWQLHRLDIIDKHRLLLTISTVNVGRTPTPSDKRTHGANRPIIGPTAQFFRQLVLGSYPAVKTLGVKAGDEIGRFPATEEYKNMGFAFDIAIDELEVITGMPTFLLLGSFSSQVLNVINDLAFFM